MCDIVSRWVKTARAPTPCVISKYDTWGGCMRHPMRHFMSASDWMKCTTVKQAMIVKQATTVKATMIDRWDYEGLSRAHLREHEDHCSRESGLQKCLST